ncbi:armadillo-type protein [Mycena leptocephala]|nr:armadillo-type protein [Mycena leptocephala]
MKLTYHIQVLDFIRKNQGSPLSTTKLEIYSLYFPWDYVSWTTKAAILEELANRVYVSEGEARAVMDSPVFHHIWEILASPDPVAQGSACWLLGLLAWYEFAIPSILEARGFGAQAVVNAKVWDPSKAADEVDISPSGIGLDQKNQGSELSTVTLETYSSWEYISHATKVAILKELANRIFASEGEARAVVDSPVFHRIWEILASPDPVAQGLACWLLDYWHGMSLLYHPSWRQEAVSNLWLSGMGMQAMVYHRQALEFIRQNKGSQLSMATLETYFLWDYVSWTTKAAILEELANRIFTSEGEARAMVDSPVFSHIWGVLAWPDPVAQGWVCWLLGLLAWYEFAIPSILEARGCERLVTLLLDQDNQVDLVARHAVQNAHWLVGVQRIVNTKVRDPSKPGKLLMRLTPPGIGLHQKESRQPAFNSNIEDVLIVFSTAILEELANRIFESEGEAQVVVDSPVFHHIWEILVSPDPAARGSACWLLGLLAWYDFAMPSILETRACEELVTLLLDQDNRADLVATHTAAQFPHWSVGVQDMVNAKALGFIRDNQGSLLSTATLKIYSSYFIWDYVSWATKAAILEELANRIFASEGEARAVVDSSVFSHIWGVLARPDPVAQGWACWLLGLLAWYEFAIPSILETRGCERLVTLLL